jgi:hypothetical protein
MRMNNLVHTHKLVDGFGSMGDGYVCVTCGYDSYHRPINSTLTQNDGTYMHFHEAPFVRKFPSQIGWGTKTDSWTHFFNTKGELTPRVNT